MVGLVHKDLLVGSPAVVGMLVVGMLVVGKIVVVVGMIVVVVGKIVVVVGKQFDLCMDSLLVQERRGCVLVEDNVELELGEDGDEPHE